MTRFNFDHTVTAPFCCLISLRSHDLTLEPKSITIFVILFGLRQRDDSVRHTRYVLLNSARCCILCVFTRAFKFTFFLLRKARTNIRTAVRRLRFVWTMKESQCIHSKARMTNRLLTCVCLYFSHHSAAGYISFQV